MWEEELSLKRRPILGTILGYVVDIVGTILSGFVIILIAAFISGARGQSGISDFQSLTRSGPLLLFSYLLGGFFSFLGGYACGLLVKTRVLLPSITLAILSVSTGLLVGRFSDIDTLDIVLSSVVAVAAILAGATLAVGKKEFRA